MKIVIDIPEKLYGLLKYFEGGLGLNDKKDSNDDVKTALMRAVINGSPLPKHHGRLIDGEKVLDDIEKKYPASVSETEQSKRYARLVYYWAVKNAPTIIEADKEGDSK